MFSKEKIIDVFSYTKSEQETFEYLHRYMVMIKPKLVEIERDNERLKRFALAGLFLTYRAFNHTGEIMTTGSVFDNSVFDNNENIHMKRLWTFKQFFQLEIQDSNDYLKIVHFSSLDFILILLRFKDISNKLYNYVMS